MPIFTNDGHIFNATFLFATGKVWNDISVSASALSKVSDVCHTHIASGFPNFSPRSCLMFGFLAETVLEHTSQLEWFFLPESKPCFLHQLIWVDGWCPRAEISSKAKSMCPPTQNSVYSHDHKHPLWCPTITLASLDVEPVQIQLQFPSSSLCCNMD